MGEGNAYVRVGHIDGSWRVSVGGGPWSPGFTMSRAIEIAEDSLLRVNEPGGYVQTTMDVSFIAVLPREWENPERRTAARRRTRQAQTALAATKTP